MANVKVLSLGGSIVMPDEVDTQFLKAFRSVVDAYLEEDGRRKLIVVVGGGKLARIYQKALREIDPDADHDEQDWIGISATHLNARLLKAVFSSHCADPVVTDPTDVPAFTGRVLVGAGWKPGFSTDYDAVLLAERFNAELVVNLTNIEKIYTADPRIDSSAAPIDHISWSEYKKIVGDEWTPGKNAPFDPRATSRAAELHLRVVSAAGSNTANTAAVLRDEPFVGTTIGPD